MAAEDRNGFDKLQRLVPDAGPLPVRLKRPRRTTDGSWIIAFTLSWEPWDLAGEVWTFGGRMALRKLEISFSLHSAAPTIEEALSQPPLSVGGVTGSLLREIPLGALIPSIQREIAAMRYFDILAPNLGREPPHNIDPRAVPEVSDAKPRRGRRPVPIDTLRELAEAAIALPPQVKGGIHKALADQFGLNKSAIRGRLEMCRDRQLLALTRRGQRGFAPGPELYPTRRTKK